MLYPVTTTTFSSNNLLTILHAFHFWEYSTITQDGKSTQSYESIQKLLKHAMLPNTVVNKCRNVQKRGLDQSCNC